MLYLHQRQNFGCSSIGKWIYMFGGNNQNKLVDSNMKIDSQTGDYVCMKKMLNPCERFGSTSFKISDQDYLIAAGGMNENEIFRKVQIYSVNEDSWKEGPELREANFDNEVVSCYGGVMMIGGRNSLKNELKTVQFWEHEKEDWISYPDTHHTYSNFGATFHENCVYVCNGKHFEVYHKDEGVWEEFEAPFDKIIDGIRLVCFKDQILTFGGYHASEGLQLHHSFIFERFDFCKRIWEEIESFQFEAFHYHRLLVTEY